MKDYLDPQKSLVLFGLNEKINFFINLYNSKKFPHVLMFSGEKGTGKFTLINHFLTYLFDKDNYNIEKYTINNQTSFYNLHSNNLFPNIIYLSGNNHKDTSINNIRNLKTKIFQSTLSSKDRFIIFDDVELFNKNVLNALLKIIEEPSSKSYYLLINNKTRPIIETIHSRSLEIKHLVDKKSRINIIELLIKNLNLKTSIDYELLNLTPGKFLVFNSLCQDNNIDVNADYINNINLLLNLYKKNKNINFINLILFLTDFYFVKREKEKLENIEKIIESKSFIINNLNNFIMYNMNQNSLINATNSKIYDG